MAGDLNHCIGKCEGAVTMYDPLRAKAKVVFYTALAFLFGLGIASGLGWTGVSKSMPVIESEPQIPESAVRPALDLSDAFVSIAEMVTPAVVRIETRRVVRVANNQDRRGFYRTEPQEVPRVSGGSGFIISDDGYILTNNHVVADADEITVFLYDRRSFTARLVGADPFTDVAVIKLDGAGDLNSISFGDSDDLRVGEWIVAVGNPGFGGTGSQLDYTVTAGIVSAMGRPLRLIQRELGNDPETAENRGFAIEDFIQTDAVINPGNSGGPMVSLRGQVVGINSAIASRTGFYQGYGFAIPINLARRVMRDLIEFGQVRRAYLGVQLQSITAVSAEAYGLPRVSGVEISAVTGNGPAEEYGVRRYDVIVAVDGEAVGRVGKLQATIAERRPGDRVTLTVYRDQREIEVVVRLGEAPLDNQPVRVASAPATLEHMDEKLGIRIENLDRELAVKYGYRRTGGAVITDIQPNGPASRQQVPEGWRVVEMNRQVVESAQDVRRVLDGVGEGDVVSLLLANNRNDQRIFHVRVPR
ncbi:MAG: trypsin-like peptidase domain-containing protein [Gemmatimonadetes bacterium]|nr:trypsin-like peptidase domain-containing protein [Gemmatimonadota bacterium]